MARRMESRRTRMVFFFQAEDGIRDKLVTGVQTCALPICVARDLLVVLTRGASEDAVQSLSHLHDLVRLDLDVRRASTHAAERLMEKETRVRKTEAARSEERRVGKECRCRWVTDR